MPLKAQSGPARSPRSRPPRFLNRSDYHYGIFIAHDPAIQGTLCSCSAPIVDHLPESSASRCFRMLASRLSRTGCTTSGLRLAAPPRGDEPASPETPQCA